MNDTAASAGRARGRSILRRITGSVWFNLIAAFVVLALVQAFLVKVYDVPSASMDETLQPGDRILVNRLAFVGAGPHTGQVVVFNASAAWGETPAVPSNPISYAGKWLGGIIGIGPSLQHTLVKRVIAGPGQRVACCDAAGRVTVDGRALNEPYVYQNLPFVPGSLDCDSVTVSLRCFGEVTVPSGEYFVLGDHRSDSDDSIEGCRGRDPTAGCLKLVRRADIVGLAFWKALPPGRWGSV